MSQGDSVFVTIREALVEEGERRGGGGEGLGYSLSLKSQTSDFRSDTTWTRMLSTTYETNASKCSFLSTVLVIQIILGQ